MYYGVKETLPETLAGVLSQAPSAAAYTVPDGDWSKAAKILLKAAGVKEGYGGSRV